MDHSLIYASIHQDTDKILFYLVFTTQQIFSH
jgi:hypothetical protein